MKKASNLRRPSVLFQCDLRSTNRKIGSAPLIYPYSAAIITPAITLPAWSVAALPYKSHAAPGWDSAVISTAIVRGAGDNATGRRGSTGSARATGRITWSRTVGDFSNEVCSAASIDPYATLIVAPAVALAANSVASLVHHAYSISRVCAAIVAVPVIGGAS